MRDMALIICLVFLVLLVFGLLFCIDADAQTIDTSFIPLGVDNSVNEFLPPIGTASLAINCDFGRTSLVLNKRKGWSAYQVGFNGSNLNGYYTGLFPYINRDGDRRLFVTWEYDDTTVNLYGVYPYAFLMPSGENNKTISGTNAYPFWYYGSDLWGTIYNNTAIFSNGYNRPLYYRGNNVRPLVEVPPGSWDMAPFAESTSTTQLLDGDYSYAFQVAMPCSDDAGVYGVFADFDGKLNLQAIPWRIHVDNDWVVIYSPQFTSKEDDCSPDSTIIKFCRTRAGGKYWDPDSFFLIRQLRIPNDTSTALLHYLDSLPDDSLGVTEFWDGDVQYFDTTDCTGACDSSKTPHPFVGFVDTTTFRVADTTTDSLYKLGRPVLFRVDTSNTNPRQSWVGISKGMREVDSSWIGTLYALAYYDSATGMVSDMGPTLYVPVAWKDTTPSTDTTYDYENEIGFSALTTERNHLQRLLLRAQVIRENRSVSDTLFVSNDSRAEWTNVKFDDCEWSPGPRHYTWVCRWSNGEIDCSHSMRYEVDGVYWCRQSPYQVHDTTLVDTQINTWRIMDTIKTATDTTYTDSLPWSKFINKDLFLPGWTQIPMNYPVEVGDYVYMASGSKVYYSAYGVEGRWSADQAVAVSIDDGDEITGMLNVDGVLYVFKNRSIHRIIQTGLDQHTVEQYVSGIGCIAPKSLINVPTGGFAFLSELGVQSFTPALVSPYKESGANRYSISGPIQSHLDAYSINDLREAYMWIDDDYNNLILSFPTLDSSKVMSLNTQQWSTWDIAFKQTGRYTQTQADDLRPSDSILGIFNSSDTIAVWGFSDKDNTDFITMTWRSHPIGFSDGPVKPFKVGIVRKSDDTTDDMNLVFYDKDDSQSGSKACSSSTVFNWVGLNVSESDWFKIEINTKIDSLAVEYVKLKYQLTGAAKEE